MANAEPASPAAAGETEAPACHPIRTCSASAGLEGSVIMDIAVQRPLDPSQPDTARPTTMATGNWQLTAVVVALLPRYLPYLM